MQNRQQTTFVLGVMLAATLACSTEAEIASTQPPTILPTVTQGNMATKQPTATLVPFDEQLIHNGNFVVQRDDKSALWWRTVTWGLAGKYPTFNVTSYGQELAWEKGGVGKAGIEQEVVLPQGQGLNVCTLQFIVESLEVSNIVSTEFIATLTDLGYNGTETLQNYTSWYYSGPHTAQFAVPAKQRTAKLYLGVNKTDYSEYFVYTFFGVSFTCHNNFGG